MRQLIPEEFCLKCQGCCRFPAAETIWSPNLLDEDIEGLLKNNIPPFFILENKKIRLSHHPDQDSFLCSFLDLSSNRCKAYAFRPFECQLYPFLINRSSAKIFLAVDIKCPFVKLNQKSREMQDYTRYLSDFLSRPDLLDALRRNAHIIQEYEGVSNLEEIKM